MYGQQQLQRYSGYQNAELGMAPAMPCYEEMWLQSVLQNNCQTEDDLVDKLIPTLQPNQEQGNTSNPEQYSSPQQKIRILQNICIKPANPNLMQLRNKLSGNTRMKDKFRIVYNDRQRIELENEFASSKGYITEGRKSELASKLGISELQVKVWFQNRRARERRKNKKRAQKINELDIGNSSLYISKTVRINIRIYNT